MAMSYNLAPATKKWECDTTLSSKICSTIVKDNCL
jgi:hypothetical protein